MVASAPLDPVLPAVGVFRSTSGRTELTVTPDNRLDLRVRTGKDVLDDEDVQALRWAVDRGRQLALARSRPDEPVRLLVLAECGHWWRESRPAGASLEMGQPRPCTQCPGGHPAAVGVSPRGLPLLPVVYLPNPLP